jgi:hypothetical protein
MNGQSKQINGFRFKLLKSGQVKIKYEKWETTEKNIPDAGLWAYNMADNNDIGNDTCRKLSKWSGIDMTGNRYDPVTDL